MKKDKTKDATTPPDEIPQSPNAEQTEQEPAPPNTANEEASGSSTHTPPTANSPDIRESHGGAPAEEEVVTPGEETVPRAVSPLSGAGGKNAEPAATNPEGPEHKLLPDTDDVTGTAVNAATPLEKIEEPSPSAKSSAVLNPVVVSFGSQLDPLIYPSLDGSAIAIGAVGPPAVLLDDSGLKDVLAGVWSDKVISGLDETGRLIGAQRFDNDPEKIFRKGRKPGVVYAALDRLTGGKLGRRRLSESTRAYGAELELKQAGSLFELTYIQRVQVGRLTEKADRMLLARQIYDEKPSVDAIKKRVAALLRKDSLDDHQTARALLRDIQTAGNLLQDEDIREFVKDKKRLQSLDPKARLGLRKGIQDVRHNVALTGDILDNLEDELWNIEREEKDKQRKADENGSTAPGMLAEV